MSGHHSNGSPHEMSTDATHGHFDAMMCALYRAQSVAMTLETLCDSKAVIPGNTKPLPGLGLRVVDLGHLVELIGLELNTALSYLEKQQ
jgi:hypothetical protein